MATFGVVLDACVHFSKRLRDTLLLAAERGLYRVLWTEQRLGELERNLLESGQSGSSASYP